MITHLPLVRTNPGKKPARYSAVVDGIDYSINEVPQDDDSREKWEAVANGRPVGEHRRFDEATYRLLHLINSEKIERAQVQLVRYIQPDGQRTLDVSANGCTDQVELSVTDDGRATTLVLDSDQVKILHAALEMVVSGKFVDKAL